MTTILCAILVGSLIANAIQHLELSWLRKRNRQDRSALHGALTTLGELVTRGERDVRRDALVVDDPWPELHEIVGQCPNCGCNNVILAVHSAYQPSDPAVLCTVCQWQGFRSTITGQVD